MNNKFFRFLDKEHDSNFNNGISYYASGLILESYLNVDGSGSPSGKDYAVGYIDPFGFYQTAWRSKDEIEIFEIDEMWYEVLKIRFDEVENIRS